MSNLSGLEGTPWHITYLRSDEPGKRRDRRGCKFYLVGNKCLKGGVCYGGRYCQEYEKREVLNKKIKKLEKNVKEKDIIKGSFVIKFVEDVESTTYKIGENINEDAPLIKIIIDTPVDSVFEINGEKGIVIDKNIKIVSSFSKNKQISKYTKEKKHKNRYEVIRKGVKEEQKKNIVEYGDIITLLCINENKEFELEISKYISTKKRNLVGICKNNRINSEFKFYGKKYKIIRIQKDTSGK